MSVGHQLEWVILPTHFVCFSKYILPSASHGVLIIIKKHFLLLPTFKPIRSLYFQTSFSVKRQIHVLFRYVSNGHIALTTYALLLRKNALRIFFTILKFVEAQTKHTSMLQRKLLMCSYVY